MADLWIGNVAGDATDEEIRDFLVKYGFPAFDGIERIPGDGSRPAVRLKFKNASPEALRRLQPRVDDLFWKNRKINVMIMPEHPD